MLVPFFKVGLKNNEYCMWITSEPIDNKKAMQILTEHIPNFSKYLQREQVEIICYSKWYLKHDKFNSTDVINLWSRKLDQVTAKGFRGIRASGNTTWLKKEDWQAFKEYECSLDKRLSHSKMIAICTYQIGKCANYKILDVINNHKYLLINNNHFNITNDISRLEQLDVMSKMSASIVHEIRNPLTSVKGFLQLMQKKEEYKKHADYFNIMLEEIDRANDIIGEFLALSTNKLSEFKSENLNEIIKAIYPLLQADAIKSSGNIILELGNISKIKAAANNIRQLLLNLVRNGLEAMPSGGNLTIKTYTGFDGEIILEVTDEGIGINPDISEKIGSPFYTTKDTGTGLGLAICKKIVAQHNATLHYKSNPKGTTFSVCFKQK